MAGRNSSQYIKLSNSFLFPSDYRTCVSFLITLSVHESTRQCVRYTASTQPIDRDSKKHCRCLPSRLLSEDTVLLLLKMHEWVSGGLTATFPRSVTPHEAEIAQLVTEFEYGCKSAGTDEEKVTGSRLFIWEEFG